MAKALREFFQSKAVMLTILVILAALLACTEATPTPGPTGAATTDTDETSKTGTMTTPIMDATLMPTPTTAPKETRIRAPVQRD